MTAKPGWIARYVDDVLVYSESSGQKTSVVLVRAFIRADVKLAGRKAT
jgi:hypothetical protein